MLHACVYSKWHAPRILGPITRERETDSHDIETWSDTNLQHRSGSSVTMIPSVTICRDYRTWDSNLWQLWCDRCLIRSPDTICTFSEDEQIVRFQQNLKERYEFQCQVTTNFYGSQKRRTVFAVSIDHIKVEFQFIQRHCKTAWRLSFPTVLNPLASSQGSRIRQPNWDLMIVHRATFEKQILSQLFQLD